MVPSSCPQFQQISFSFFLMSQGRLECVGNLEKEEAKQKYIATLNHIVPGWKGGNTTSTSGVKESWRAVSSPQFEDIE